MTDLNDSDAIEAFAAWQEAKARLTGAADQLYTEHAALEKLFDSCVRATASVIQEEGDEVRAWAISSVKLRELLPDMTPTAWALLLAFAAVRAGPHRTARITLRDRDSNPN